MYKAGLYILSCLLGIFALYFAILGINSDIPFFYALALCAVSAAFFLLPDRRFYTTTWALFTTSLFLFRFAYPYSSFTEEELKKIYNFQCGAVFSFASGVVLLMLGRAFHWPFFAVAIPVIIFETTAAWLVFQIYYLIVMVVVRWKSER